LASDPKYQPGQVVNGRTICGAKTKAETPCGLNPLEGGTRCKKHGGGSPQARKAAEKRLAEAQVQKELERGVRTLGLPIDIDPGKALLDHVFWLTTWERRAGGFGEKIGLTGSGGWQWLPASGFGKDGWGKFDSIRRHTEETSPTVSFWIDDDLLHEPEARLWAIKSGVHWFAPHGLHGITPENIRSMRRTLSEAKEPACVPTAPPAATTTGNNATPSPTTP